MKPGLYDDLDEREYHAHPTSLSVSGAKLILKAPALYRWRQDHPEHKDVFDFGSAAHALVLGVGMESIYVAPYDDWTRRKGPEGGVQYTTDEKRIGREDGLSVILPKEWEVVCDMADKLSSHTLAMHLLSEGQAEVSAFCEDEPTGVLRRGRFDWLGSTICTDYKSAVSSEPTAFIKAAVNNGYHMQHPWYLDLAADLGHPAEAFAFIVQEKEPPYLVTVIELPPELVNIGRARNRHALERFRDCTESGIWPGYIPDTEFAQPPAPTWALREDWTA